MDNISTNLVRFRSAVGGFNRADVIRYLEQSSQQVQKEKKALEDEIARLKERETELSEENASLRAALEEAEARLAEAEAAAEETAAAEASGEAAPLPDEAESAQTEAPEAALADEADEPESGEGEVPVMEEELPTQALEEPPLETQELEAYRRAEAVERLARRRAAVLSRQVTEIQDGALSRLDELSQETGSLYGEVSNNLGRLKDALAELHVLFRETEDALRELELSEGSAGSEELPWEA